MTTEYEYACQEWWPEAGRWTTVGGGPGALWQALDTLNDWQKDKPESRYRLVRREIQHWTEVDRDGALLSPTYPCTSSPRGGTCRCWQVRFPDGHVFCCTNETDAQRNARIYRGDGATVVPPATAHEHEFSYDEHGRMRCTCGTYLFEHAPGHPYGSQPGPGGMYARWCLRDDCDWRQSGRIAAGALVATFLACVIGISLFTLAVMGARTGLCKVDDTHSYCHAGQR